jgi:GNAT superfamily N-acetyltransferase
MSAQGQQLDLVTIENLQEQDLAEADHIFRLAFGTFIGVPDPASFHQGADYVRTRWKADPAAAFAAKIQGRLVGTNFATSWGSFGFFGPLTIHPDYWDRGVGKRLVEPVMDLFSEWQIKQAGLFTFAQSRKLVWDKSRLVGLATCHCGEGSEAGPDVCFVKFAAVRQSSDGTVASRNFDRLLSACESLAAQRGLPRLLAGVNTARTEAYQQMMIRGFKTEMQGVAMHAPNEPAYSMPGVFVLDDWR